MSGASWDPAESGGAEPVPVKERRSLINLHFMLSALFRHRRLVASCAVIGFFAGIALAVLSPLAPVATASVLLTRDKNVDPDRAVATDVALAATDQVLGRTADELHLGMTATDFGKAVTVTMVTDDVVNITVSAPGNAAAIDRANAVAATFLRFRADILTQQAQVIADTLRSRIAELNAEVQTLTTRINSTDPADAARLSDLVAKRTQTTSRIDDLQDQVQTALLSATSVSASSRLLDGATINPQSWPRRIVISGAGGLFIGAALSALLVMVVATLSWRVRRREDVADALDAPVRSLSGGRRLGRRERHLLADTVVELARKGRALGWVTVGTPSLSIRLVVNALSDLAAEGRQVLLVDLLDADSPGGPASPFGPFLRSPVSRVRRQLPRDLPVIVPEGDVLLAQGPLGRTTAAADAASKDLADRFAAADLVVVLAPVSPALGVDHLRTWLDGAVVTVAAGACTPERLHTTAQLLRAAGIRLYAGLLLDADRDDESLGLPHTGSVPEPLVHAVAQ